MGERRRVAGRLRGMALGLALALAGGAAEAAPYSIEDREGFGAALPALTLDLPPGWQGTGKVIWNKPCSNNDLFEVIFTATAPDGQSGMRIMPGHRVIWSDVTVDASVPADLARMTVAQAESDRAAMHTAFKGSNCHVGRVAGTEALVAALILPNRPAGARVLRMAPNETQRATYAATFTVAIPGFRTRWDAVAVDLGYAGPAGPVVERIWLSWYQFSDDPAAAPIPGVPGLHFEHTYVESLAFAWAPEARAAADLAAAEASLRGIRPEIDWARRVKEVQDRLAEERRRLNEERQRAFDRRHEEFMDYIRQ